MDKKIIIGVSTTRTFLAWIIRFFTKQKASHAWISYFDETLDQRMVMEASYKGYRILPFNQWKKIIGKGLKIWAFVCSESLESGIKEISKKLGSEYDIKFMVWHALKRWFKRLWRHPGNSPNKLACSEAVIRIIQSSGVSDAMDKDPELITPGDLLSYMESSKYFSILDVTKNMP